MKLLKPKKKLKYKTTCLRAPILRSNEFTHELHN